MTRTVFSNSEVVDEFFNGNVEHGRNSKESIFFVNNEHKCVIYSYGTHFPMAVKSKHNVNFFVVNGDTYSSTTAKHQSMVRSEIAYRHIPHCIVPFSALERAGVEPSEIEMIDKEPDREIEVWRKNRLTGEKELHPSHLMGSTLFKAYATPDVRQFEGIYKAEEKYFLSGLDESATDPWRSFFLVELVKPCESVAEAYESMKPLEVRAYEQINNVKALRQGEFFFIPAPTFNPPLGYVDKDVYLTHPVLDKDYIERSGSRWVTDTRNHRASYGCVAEIGGLNITHVKGYVRHDRKEHKQLVLKNVWHKVVPNLVKSAYSAGGRID